MFGIGNRISFYICKDFLLTTMLDLKPDVLSDTEKYIQLRFTKKKRTITLTMKQVSGKIQIEVDDTDYLLHIKTESFKKEEDVQMHILNVHKQIYTAIRG